MEIHFGVAFDKAVEEKSGKALGLGVGAEARIEVGRIGFDDEDDGGGVGGCGVGAGGEEERGSEKKRESQRITTEGAEEPQRTQRSDERKEKIENRNPRPR
ncbi:MAG TPA: hypothetical protein VJY15_15875 [Candidatus Acidoferrum sp.]|nr:hypothetical protein [Candidatus Acidoferrum sp.]